jgi:hypothetical protein
MAHGLVDRSILRSRAGVRAVSISLGVLGLTAAIKAAVFVSSGSVALLADTIHRMPLAGSCDCVGGWPGDSRPRRLNAAESNSGSNFCRPGASDAR